MPKLFIALQPGGLAPSVALAGCLQALGSPSNGVVVIQSAQDSLNGLEEWLAAALALKLLVCPCIEVQGAQKPSVALVKANLDAYALLVKKYSNAVPHVLVDNYRLLLASDWGQLLANYPQFIFTANLGLPFTKSTSAMPPTPTLPAGFKDAYQGIPARQFTAALVKAVPGVAVGVWAGRNGLTAADPGYCNAWFTSEYRDTWEDAIAAKASGTHIVAYDANESRIVLPGYAMGDTLADLTAFYANGKTAPWTEDRWYATCRTELFDDEKPAWEVLSLNGVNDVGIHVYMAYSQPSGAQFPAQAAGKRPADYRPVFMSKRLS